MDSFEEIKENPPKGAYIYEDFDTITIGTSTGSLVAAVLLLIIPGAILGFMCMFSYALLSVFIQQVHNAADIFSSPLTFLLALFVLLTCGGSLLLFILILISLIMTISGKVEVVLGKDSYVFTGIGKIGIKKSFDRLSVKNVYKRRWITTRLDSSRRKTKRVNYEIIIEENKKINFGKILQGLYEEQFHFILAALEYYLVKKAGNSNR